MEIRELLPQELSAAAGLFCLSLARLRQSAPALPGHMLAVDRVREYLQGLAARGPILAAVEGDRLAGYLGCFDVPNFRGTGRKAAYAPEWGHAALPELAGTVYRQLYQAASRRWWEAGCQVHAITLLATETQAVETWFWSGFGLAVVDAVRPVRGLGRTPPAGWALRKAAGAEIELLVRLELEHRRHYNEPPVLMCPREPRGPAEFARLLQEPGSSAWLACAGEQPQGFITFTGQISDAADIVCGEKMVGITGAYLRSEYRGAGVVAALLDAALQDYASQGYQGCAVDFETLNPEAASFWPRFFQPVCYSLIRVPEQALVEPFRQPGG